MDSHSEEAFRYFLRQQEKVRHATATSRQYLLSLQVPEHNGWSAVDIKDPTVFYKVVASVSGELLSIGDGITRFGIGRWTLGKYGANGWPPLSACFDAYQQPEQALAARFPKDCKLRVSPKVLIEVTASGKAYFNRQTNTWALSKLRPVRILPNILPAPRNGRVPVGPAERPATPERVRIMAILDGQPAPWVP